MTIRPSGRAVRRVRASVRTRAAVATVAAICVAPAILHAQCPDGTPPPCAAPRTARRSAPPPPAERARRFVVIPFRNLSRSPELEWLVEGSTTLLADALGRWREVSVVPEERLVPALRRAGLTPGAVADLASLRRIADETGGWTAVTGEMLSTAGRVAVRARAIDAATGRELARGSYDAAPGEDVREAFGRVGAQLLRAAGLDTAAVDIGAATTRSLDAYRGYVRGIALRNRNQYRRAAVAFGEAIAHDSGFAQAWFELVKVRVFEGPAALFEEGGDLPRAIGRVVELAERLPPRRRDVIRAVGTMFRGQFGAAREVLERLVAADSMSADAVGWLSFLEFVDPVLVQTPTGRTRRRGSLNRAVVLARRLLELEPDGHGAYIPIVYAYLLAAGDLPTVMIAFGGELTSLDQMLRTMPAEVYVPLLRDTIVPVPVDAFLQLPAESVANARRRALDAAAVWVGRWLAVGPGEGAAHQAASRISEMRGDYDAALARLRTADSLGVEFGYISPWWQRLILLGRARRYQAATAMADSTWRDLANGFAVPTEEFEARRWVFTLFVMRGDFARAETLVTRLAAGLGRMGPGVPLAFARQLSLTVLAGRSVPPYYMSTLPLAVRLDALDGAWGSVASAPAEDAARRTFDQLAAWAAQDARADSAAAARVRAAPWLPQPTPPR